MPFRDRFDCLWCGAPHVTRSTADLEGWAQLCPTCLGKAGTNAFLRSRLRSALAERARQSTGGRSQPSAAGAGTSGSSGSSGSSRSSDRPAAPGVGPVAASTGVVRPRSPAFPDDWFLRRGPFEHGAIHDTAWQAELDVVTRWLDGLALAGRIDEPAAGVGFFSPLLAETGELHASDEDGAALDLARDRLVAHRLLAHLHVADPWSVEDAGRADAVVASFLVGRVRGAGLDAAVASLRARLRRGGRLALIDLRPDAAGGPPPGVAWTYHDPIVLEAALARAGFADIERVASGRFFVLVRANAA
jgi:SAM-dependent methyltransferase